MNLIYQWIIGSMVKYEKLYGSGSSESGILSF
jgi:hypothetical protein